MIKEYPILPVPKPRMTRRDKWLNPPRPCVARYRAFHNFLQVYRFKLPLSEAHIEFTLPMPKSWNKNKKAYMDGRPHQQRPDLDNLLKAVFEIYSEDSLIWDIRTTKRWGHRGKIQVD